MQWAYGVLVDTVPALAADVADVRVLREGPKRLAVVTVSGDRPLALKQYADDRGAWTRRWLQRLTDAGLTAPSRFTVTPARGWSGRHRTLVTDLATGRPWADWTLTSTADRESAAVAAADWVTELQSLLVALPRRTDHRAGMELHLEAARLAYRFPRHAAHLRRVVDSVDRVLYDDQGAPAPDLVASHGDLHPENLFLAADMGVTAIDVDTAGLRRPSYDVGYALAQLLILSWLHTGSFETGADAGARFWRHWAAGSAVDAEAVPAEIARALVQSLHFELVTYRTGRTELINRWLHVADTVLTTDLPTALAALTEEPTP
ncbi:MAG TPA: aminoglycoside phosphotransferase family protein [Marmoricola sp.]|nr:aminoglycoside phosphotransferase family protein [Marmoricola sp.]